MGNFVLWISPTQNVAKNPFSRKITFLYISRTVPNLSRFGHGRISVTKSGGPFEYLLNRLKRGLTAGVTFYGHFIYRSKTLKLIDLIMLNRAGWKNSVRFFPSKMPYVSLGKRTPLTRSQKSDVSDHAQIWHTIRPLRGKLFPTIWLKKIKTLMRKRVFNFPFGNCVVKAKVHTKGTLISPQPNVVAEFCKLWP